MEVAWNFIKEHFSEKEMEEFESLRNTFDAEAVVGSPVTQVKMGVIPRPSAGVVQEGE